MRKKNTKPESDPAVDVQRDCSTARGTYEGAGEGYCTNMGGYYNLSIRVSIADGERIIKDNPQHQVTLQW